MTIDHSQEVVALAEIFREGVAREVVPAPVTGGLIRRQYLAKVYNPVVKRKSRLVCSGRRADMWVSLQWLLEARSKPRRSRAAIKYEGFPGGLSYEEGLTSIESGDFERPYVFVAGPMRTGTTSIQNTVLTFFARHLQPGDWNTPPFPLRPWHVTKHNPNVAEKIEELSPHTAQVLVTIRPFLESAISKAHFNSRDLFEDVDWADLESYAHSWQRFHEMAANGRSIPVPLSSLSKVDPVGLARRLDSAMGLESTLPSINLSWHELDARGVSFDMTKDSARSNVPNNERQLASERIADKVRDYFKSRLSFWDELYASAFDKARSLGL